MRPGELIKCRICETANDVDRHHIVPRSIRRDDHELNLVPVCRADHRAIHRKEVDLLPWLTLEEQAHAAGLIGLQQAFRLLAPTAYAQEIAA